MKCRHVLRFGTTEDVHNLFTHPRENRGFNVPLYSPGGVHTTLQRLHVDYTVVTYSYNYSTELKHLLYTVRTKGMNTQ